MSRFKLVLRIVGGALWLTFSCSPFAGSPAVADAATDASADASDTGTCFDLSSAAAPFASTMAGGGTTSLVGGHRISYPVGDDTAKSVASWQHTVPLRPGVHGAIVTIDAMVTLPAALAASKWYAAFAGLSNGDQATIDTASLVDVVLANDATDSAAIDVRTFPTGPSAVGGATTAGTFDSLDAGSTRSVRMILDVEWSTDAMRANVTASLYGHPTKQVSAVTLSGSINTAWTLLLGGAAAGNPAITIVFTRACIAQRA